jgi:hypothetical protein
MDRTPMAFMSYVDQDNQYEEGRLAELGQRLRTTVRFHTGDDWGMFQEHLDIAWGQNWQEQIHVLLLLDEARFLIPVMAPRFFQERSRLC